jgi:hypothetical protein
VQSKCDAIPENNMIAKTRISAIVLHFLHMYIRVLQKWRIPKGQKLTATNITIESAPGIVEPPDLHPDEARPPELRQQQHLLRRVEGPVRALPQKL